MGAGVLTLNLHKKCGEYGNECQCSGKSGEFIAEKKPESPTNGFTKVTHQHKNGRPFKLNKKLSNGEEIKEVVESVREPISGVKEVAVCYWNSNLSNPLLLGITMTNTPIYYVRSNGNDWNFISHLNPEALETKLENLNCEHNKAVTMDLSYKNVPTGSHHNYCCSGSHSGDGRVQRSNRVTITSVQISCNQSSHPSSNLTAYKHSINDGRLMLAAIKFYLGGDQNKRRRVTSRRLSLPIKGPVDVYAFYCSDHNPVLIYVESTGSPPVNSWYRKTNSTNWTKVELKNITPENFGGLECQQWNSLVDALKRAGCGGYQPCPGAPQVEPTEDKTEAAPLQQDSPGLVTPKASTRWDVISGVLTGVGVVSGSLTGFGWWIYKRSKGDPWVRQI